MGETAATSTCKYSPCTAEDDEDMYRVCPVTSILMCSCVNCYSSDEVECCLSCTACLVVLQRTTRTCTACVSASGVSRTWRVQAATTRCCWGDQDLQDCWRRTRCPAGLQLHFARLHLSACQLRLCVLQPCQKPKFICASGASLLSSYHAHLMSTLLCCDTVMCCAMLCCDTVMCCAMLCCAGPPAWHAALQASWSGSRACQDQCGTETEGMIPHQVS